MKKLIIALCLCVSVVTTVSAQKGFAIVVDPQSYKEATTEIEAYAAAIESTQGLKVYTVVDHWGVPDSIRQELIRLYQLKKNPIEGAVFVGDIPIAMVRDAQHMTSAFKMNQKHDRKESSIPSDRYYDDFDLDFTYLDKETDLPYYYYSLTAASAQHLCPEIYTGRIRPSDSEGSSRYEKLRQYLKKATAAKLQENVLDQLFFFSGHGYISESMVARMDEKGSLYEHFPWLRTQQNAISFIDHSQEDRVKFKLMNELMREELDFAILHHHGAPDTQYLNGIPSPDYPTDAKEYIQSYGRAKIRAAKDYDKDPEVVKANLCKMFDVPSAWFDNVNDKDIEKKDSIDNDNLDLHLADFDIYNYRPNSKVVMIDACYCGSYHLSNCIANAYIFSEGQTVTCVANSVNVLQDKWSDRYMGLLGLGMNVGNIARFSGYLESHTIGDPTFRFTSADKNIDVQKCLAKDKASAWKKQLKSEYPDMQCMAIGQLSNKGAISSEQLMEIFRTSPYAMVRLEALVQLSKIRDDNFIEAIKLAVNDSHELVQRYGIRFTGKSGHEALIPELIRLSISNNTSERCNFNTMSALALFPEEKLLAEFEKQFDSEHVNYIDKEKVREIIRQAISSSATKWVDEVDEIVAADTKEKTRLMNIRTLRNYCVHYRIPELLEYLRHCNDAKTQVALLEALGWQEQSYMCPAMMDTMKEMMDDTRLPEDVRNEAKKSYKRLSQQ